MSQSRKESERPRSPMPKISYGKQEREEMVSRFLEEQDGQNERFLAFVDEVEIKAAKALESRAGELANSIVHIGTQFERALADYRRRWNQERVQMENASIATETARSERAQQQRLMQDKLHDSGIIQCNNFVAQCETPRDALTKTVTASFKAAADNVISRRRKGRGVTFAWSALPSVVLKSQTEFTVGDTIFLAGVAKTYLSGRLDELTSNKLELSEEPLQDLEEAPPYVPEALEVQREFDSSAYDRLAIALNNAFQQSQTLRQTMCLSVHDKLDYDVRQIVMPYRVKQLDIRGSFKRFLDHEMVIIPDRQPKAAERAIQAFRLVESSRADLFGQAIYMAVERWKLAVTSFLDELRSSERRLMAEGLIRLRRYESVQPAFEEPPMDYLTVGESPPSGSDLASSPSLSAVEFVPSALPSLLKRIFKRRVALPVLQTQHHTSEWQLFIIAQKQREVQFCENIAVQHKNAAVRERQRQNLLLRTKRTCEDDARLREEKRATIFDTALARHQETWRGREAAREKEFEAVVHDMATVFAPAHKKRILTFLDSFRKIHEGFMAAARDAAHKSIALTKEIAAHGYVIINATEDPDVYFS